jgi:hypothetical protein
MNYYTINRMIADATIDDVELRVRSALSKHGFGVLTESTSRQP